MIKHTKIWRIPKPNPALQEIFILKLGVSRVIAQILVNRGITTLEEARAFLSGEAGVLHDPFLMKDIDKAAARIRRALENGEKIRIFGDYDVDGITSTAVLLKVLTKLGADVDYYIPERLTEGYGMNQEAVGTAGLDGVSLIVTVDSGISSLEEIEAANRAGIDVIVTDHHEPPEETPRAVAVVNPKQKDCPYPFRDLAGVGVAFKLAQALLTVEDPILEELNELVCLGTIADIVPLKGENRALVKSGLNLLARTKSVGLRALMDQCGVNAGQVNSRQIAFQVAPKINAAGRLGDATVGVKLLLSEDEEEAATLAAELCALNEERQGIEAAIYKEALQIIEAGGINLDREKVIVLAREGWHLGVMGIVASKLVQDYYRPVVLLSIDGNRAKGSARSIPSFNIFEAFKHNNDYLERYGGHKQAAGLTIPVDNIPLFSAAIKKYAEENLGDEDLKPEVYIDSEIDFTDLDENLYKQLQMLDPHGCENPEPILVCRQASVMEYRTVGSDGSHLKMRIRDKQFVFDAIGFNLGRRHTMLAGDDDFDIVFALEKNEWNGRTTFQLNVKDFKPSALVDNPFQQGDLFQEDAGSKAGFIEELFQNAVTYLTDDYYRDIGDKDEFYTKVVGVTFEDRQAVAAELYNGEKLNLLRQPNNPFDSNAVRVENGSGAQVGFLNARLAKHFAPLLDRGEQYFTYVSQVTGGGDKNYGVNIIMQKVRDRNWEEQQVLLARLREELACLPDDELMERIRQTLLGGNPYREKQLEALDQLFLGRNTMAIFGTGRGKSAVFQSMAAFKALREREMTAILYPLRALVNDQFENMSARLTALGLRVYRGNGSISSMERVMLFEALEKEEIDILLTTPEFAARHIRKLQSMKKRVGLFVVDESHHIGMSSQAHRPIYKQTGELAESLGSPVVIAATATANEETAGEIINTLKIEKVIIDPHIRTNLQLVDRRDCPDKNGYLKQVVSTGTKTIIYVNSRLQTVELAAMLRESLPQMANRIIFYHAGLKSEHRNTIEKMFRGGEVSVVVATSAFGEGIDIPDVKHIVVFHLNFNFTEFNQQCGRCGRDGQTAQIYLLCGRRDAAINQFILETAAPDRDTLAKLYTVLKAAAEKSHPVILSNEDIAKQLRFAGIRYARPNLVSAGLGIIEELELIQRETIGRDRQIYLLAAPGEKIDIERSLRFIEGREEKQAFQDFQDYFFKASSEELLSCINSPIYPGKLLTTAI
ncbi:MAG: single-stranded-DNA-specific exonuclease RecJ [Eubacteriales bacterium]